MARTSSRRRTTRSRSRKKRQRTSRSRSRSKSKSRSRASSKSESSSSSPGRVTVNRSPVLMLWVALVAQREGYKFAEGLSFAKAVAAICARSKGRAIGLFKPRKVSIQRRAALAEKSSVKKYSVFGMKLPGKRVGGRIYAFKSDRILHPEPAHDYLKRSFGGKLSQVKGERVPCLGWESLSLFTSAAAFRKLASKYRRADIGKRGYGLYERFRPVVARGVKGWGARGVLDLVKVYRLANKKI